MASPLLCPQQKAGPSGESPEPAEEGAHSPDSRASGEEEGDGNARSGEGDGATGGEGATAEEAKELRVQQVV